jgi:2-oxoglutarate dehydrogenase E2 component (dihydrolipoamide succinyltransferase)
MASTLDIRAPQEQTEGTRSQVLRWLKSIGDEVSEHEPLIEIETDKVTVEVPAPATGVLREIVKGEQEEIAPGDVLGRMELAGAAASSSALLAAGAAPHAATQPSVAPQSLPAAGAGAQSSDERAANRAPSNVDAISQDAAAASGSFSRLSPAVRRLIAERGLDPSTIRATGEGGRITIDDVLAHTGNGLAASAAPPSSSEVAAQPRAASSTSSLPFSTSAPPSAPAASSSTPTASSAASTSAGESSADSKIASHSVPHTAVRKRIAEHMVQSLLHTAPHVTTMFEVDMTAVMAHRAHHKAEFEKRRAPLTFTAYFLAAAVEAIRAVPEANSRWTDSALEVYDDIHIGVATALEGGGLMVPVLRNVQSRNLFEIASGLHALVTAARESRLQPADVRGGTFTISNHGVSGSLLAAPIVINQPQSAILGVGKLEKRPVVVEQNGEERIVVQPKCYVTLTIDHRVMDGHQANRFLQTFVRTLESWPAT